MVLLTEVHAVLLIAWSCRYWLFI